jgi:hypothetical protein
MTNPALKILKNIYILPVLCKWKKCHLKSIFLYNVKEFAMQISWSEKKFQNKHALCVVQTKFIGSWIYY